MTFQYLINPFIPKQVHQEISVLERVQLSLPTLKIHQNTSTVTVMVLHLAVNLVEVQWFTLLNADGVSNKDQVS